uniref:Uncharacterized protein n=1 Tax=Sphaerodactylus townsendi TaxID=933632 RepID=A0ACB8EDD6_9SAUR
MEENLNSAKLPVFLADTEKASSTQKLVYQTTIIRGLLLVNVTCFQALLYHQRAAGFALAVLRHKAMEAQQTFAWHAAHTKPLGKLLKGDPRRSKPPEPPACMSVCNNGIRMPSPHEASNGFPQPSASGTWHKSEEDTRLVEAGLVKKAHREILDHERKRRVELKCMELQEMMEEEG